MTDYARNPFPGVPHVESPLFQQLFAEKQDHPWFPIARDLNEQGFAVIDFPDDALDARMDRLIEKLTPEFGIEAWLTGRVGMNHGGRLQDIWESDEDVRAIAMNQTVLDILSFCYGRDAFPFQTLNFPAGTQQHFHTDAMHFSSIPERFMCGVWLAMEDMHEDNGPLVYYPGSHKLPFYSNDQLGVLRGTENPNQDSYYDAWEALMDVHGIEPRYFHAKRGQALIWAANLMHGGAPRKKLATRWSQVTHYYFKDCAYYTPINTDLVLGRGLVRAPRNILTGGHEPNSYLGQPVNQRYTDMLLRNLHDVQSGKDMSFQMPRTKEQEARRAARKAKKAQKLSLGQRIKRAIKNF